MPRRPRLLGVSLFAMTLVPLISCGSMERRDTDTLVGVASSSPRASLREAARAIREDSRTGPLLDASAEHRTRVLLSVVDESADPPVLVETTLGGDGSYFYPASSIKLFAAVGALLRIQEFQASGVPITVDTPLVFHPLFGDGPPEDADDSNAGYGEALKGRGAITVRHEIRKLFIVSDNRAFNRLLGFVGRADLNEMMRDAELRSVRVHHRLSVGHSREQNRAMPRIDCLLGDGRTHTIPARTEPAMGSNAGVPRLLVGSAEIVDGDQLDRPKDFGFSNRVSLVDLRDAAVMILRPDVELNKPGFELTDAHRELLIDAMGSLPRESANPAYDPAQYPDDWAKFLLPGLRRAIDADRVRVLNKIGLAYGFTTTTAGIALDGAPPGVFVTGTVYTNENGVLNDNVYEYESVALPFWADLGEIVARRLVVPASGRADDRSSMQTEPDTHGSTP